MSLRLLGSARLQGIGCVLAAVVLWSTVPVGTRLLVQSGGAFSSEFLSAVRLGIAALVFFGIRLLYAGPAGWRFRFHRRQIPWLLVAGVGLFLNYWLYSLGLRYTSAGATAVISQIHTVATVLLAAVLLNERLSVAKGLGMTVAMGGVLLVMMRGIFLQDFIAEERMLGNLLQIGAALAWPLYAIGQAKAQEKNRGQEVLTPIFAVAAVLMLLTLPFTGTAVQQPQPWDWGVLLFLGLGSTAAAYWLYALAMLRIETSEAAILSVLSTPMAIGISVLMLGERVTLGAAIGVALVMLGLALTVWHRMPGGLRRPRTVPENDAVSDLHGREAVARFETPRTPALNKR
ncbi:MAG: DMT family transporter [Armatimonadota bacterium]